MKKYQNKTKELHAKIIIKTRQRHPHAKRIKKQESKVGEVL